MAMEMLQTKNTLSQIDTQGLFWELPIFLLKGQDAAFVHVLLQQVHFAITQLTTIVLYDVLVVELFYFIDLILLIINKKYIELSKLLGILKIFALVYWLDSNNDSELEIKDFEYLGVLGAVNELAFVMVGVGYVLAMVSFEVVEVVYLFLEGVFIDGRQIKSDILVGLVLMGDEELFVLSLAEESDVDVIERKGYFMRVLVGL